MLSLRFSFFSFLRNAGSSIFRKSQAIAAGFYIFLLWGCQLNAQMLPEPAFRNYNVEQGLLVSEIYHVMQDSKGFMWFSTNYGVSCFDGYNFRNYTMEDGLPDNTIFECYEDYKGRIWFVSFSCKLSYFENGKVIQYRYNDKLLKHINTNSLKTSFHVDKDDKIFLSLFWQGTFVVDNIGNVTEQKEETTTVNEKENGRFFCSTFFEEVNRPDPRSLEVLKHEIVTMNFYFKKETFRFYSIDDKVRVTPQVKFIKWKNSQFILCVGRKLFELDTAKSTFNLVRSFNNRIIDVFADRNGLLWVAPEKEGIYALSKQNKILYHFLNGITVTSITQDREEGYWFTTTGNGIFYTPSINILNYTIGSHFPAGGNPVAIAQGNGKTYLAVHGQGVYEQKGSIFKRREDIHYSHISDIKYDIPGKKLWVAAPNATISISENNSRSVTTNISFLQLHIAGNDLLWGIANDRIIKLKKGVEIVNSRSVTTPFRSSCIALDKDGDPILGNVYGLWSFKNNRVGKYDSTQAFLNNKITAVAADKYNNLYVGSGGFGLWIKRNNRTHILTRSDGIIDNYIKSIFVDGDSLWIGTNKGISCILLSSLGVKAPAITNITSQEGLISEEVNQISVTNDTVWVVSKKGLSFFDRRTLRRDNPAPLLHFNKILVNDLEVNKEELLDLDYNENQISFYYSGLSFKDNKSIVYRYKLVPLDSSWRFTSNRDVRYTTIPPGKYTFIVSAGKTGYSNRSNSLIFPIAISPPWWLTWESKLAFFLVSSAFILAYLRHRIKKVQQENRLEKKIFELESKALRAQMNPHFIFNCLNSIQSFIAVNDTRSAEKYLAEFARLIRMILDNSRESSISIAQEMETLRYYLNLERQRFNNNFNFVLEVASEVEINEIYIPSMLIQPYIENAILHGLSGMLKNGVVLIKFERFDTKIKCTVEDNGVGREKTMTLKRSSRFNYRSAGSEISRERFEVMNSSPDKKDYSVVITDLKDQDNMPSGTCVELFMTPLKRQKQ